MGTDTRTSISEAPPCPRCGDAQAARNGVLRSGSPQLLCRACGRRFVAETTKGLVSDERMDLVHRLRLERMSLRAIARIVGVSRCWLQGFVNSLDREAKAWDPGPLEESRTG